LFAATVIRADKLISPERDAAGLLTGSRAVIGEAPAALDDLRSVNNRSLCGVMLLEREE